jgi:hypothetical protein
MSGSILLDARSKPQLFVWNGPVSPQELARWQRRLGWNVPPDLLSFWALTGGGRLFESETILRPILPDDHDGSVDQVTNWRRANGMPVGLVVFHEGLSFTAVRSVDGAYVWLDESSRVRGVYSSLDDWYRQVLRDEYGSRYGLDPI